MKRSVEGVRVVPSTGAAGAAPLRKTSAGSVTRLHGYRRRARILKTLDAAQRSLLSLYGKLLTVPGAFWAGLLAGLLLGALLVVATGHVGLFVRPFGPKSAALSARLRGPG